MVIRLNVVRTDSEFINLESSSIRKEVNSAKSVLLDKASDSFSSTTLVPSSESLCVEGVFSGIIDMLDKVNTEVNTLVMIGNSYEMLDKELSEESQYLTNFEKNE